MDNLNNAKEFRNLDLEHLATNEFGRVDAVRDPEDASGNYEVLVSIWKGRENKGAKYIVAKEELDDKARQVTGEAYGRELTGKQFTPVYREGTLYDMQFKPE